MEFNLATLHERLAEAVPERECLVHRDRRLSWAQVTERTRRLANYLGGRGLGCHVPRKQLASWQSGQDHLALYLHNGPEYLEGMLAAFKARVAPFNVNYRYVETELLYLLNDARARGIVYHACFAPMLAKIRPELPELEVLIQVADGSGHPLLPGAIDYESAIAAGSPERPDLEWSPNDLYILYTGGTTGMPKGVLWRQHDVFVAALGGRNIDGRAFTAFEPILERTKLPPSRVLATPPMMHGAAHWASFICFHGGGTVVMQDNVERLDAHDVLSVAAREKTSSVLLVGDAFGRPLVDALRARSYELPELKLIISSGAALHATLKQELLQCLPHVAIVDAVGASETGGQGMQVSTRDQAARSGEFTLGPGSCVLDAELTRVLQPGDASVGWFAQRGHVPLGYLGDREKTARTFPVVDGVRYSVPGDRARMLAKGQVELLGRDSVTINSGGEKIFAEEVEHALKQHPAVYDAVVCGRPSERWGQEVCAIVQLRPGVAADEQALLAECERHLARFKLPKAILFRDAIVRSPSGKADYRWAKAEVAAAAEAR